MCQPPQAEVSPILAEVINARLLFWEMEGYNVGQQHTSRTQ